MNELLQHKHVIITVLDCTNRYVNQDESSSFLTPVNMLL